VQAHDLRRAGDAQNMTVIRPFSRRCAIVSTPLPTKSRYATVRASRMRSESAPFGDRFTRPLAPAGAVATKKTR
jgi:hypothetical protein